MWEEPRTARTFRTMAQARTWASRRCSPPPTQCRSTRSSWGRMQRSAVSPGMARKLMDMTAQTNLGAILPTISAGLEHGQGARGGVGPVL
jgi:hypothetical protein